MSELIDIVNSPEGQQSMSEEDMTIAQPLSRLCQALEERRFPGLSIIDGNTGHTSLPFPVVDEIWNVYVRYGDDRIEAWLTEENIENPSDELDFLHDGYLGGLFLTPPGAKGIKKIDTDEPSMKPLEIAGSIINAAVDYSIENGHL